MKNRVEVVIAGNRFTMTGDQDEEYMQKIAGMVDEKVCEIRSHGANLIQSAMLAACDIADSHVQAVLGADNLRKQIASYLDENKDLTRELSEARDDIRALQDEMAQKDKEMTEVNSFKARIAELEEKVEAGKADKVRITELEDKLTQAEKRAQNISAEVDARTRRVSELEQQLTEANARHDNDLEQAERMGREMCELRAKVADCDKKQRRIEELEKELASTERQLNEVRSRLSRLLK
ncbi:MAG: cell division protein ZapA [Eubacteriales bacterium]|nr:cell division protein ZapA [Eubacteriales bacterium]